MPSDEEDTPKGALLAMTLLTLIILFIVVGTFESCTDLEGDKVRDFCSDIRFQMDSYLGESYICFTESGLLKFSVVNTGDVDIEGFVLRYLGKEHNITTPVYVISSEQFSVDVGLENYDLMTTIEVIPLAYYGKSNTTTKCTAVRQFIKNADICTGG